MRPRGNPGSTVFPVERSFTMADSSFHVVVIGGGIGGLCFGEG